MPPLVTGPTGERPPLEVLADPEAVAARAAAVVASAIREAVGERDRCLLALSGGRTPWTMIAAVGAQPLPWERVHVFQVDERVAPAGHPDRNLVGLVAALGDAAARAHLHPMPVEAADLDAAAAAYADELATAAGGAPAVLDLVHLGLGEDGHTASLVPGDPALEAEADVAVTGVYRGRRRMTLTRPVLDRARRVLWVVTGSGKAAALRGLRSGDRTIPAGRIAGSRALVVADRAAAP